MKNQTLFLATCFQLLVATLGAQISFSNKTNLLTPIDHRSGVAIAIIDMNGDGLDDIARMELGTNLNIQYQSTPNEPFTTLQVGNLPGNAGSQWGMCTGDVDNNGFADVLAGGYYDGVKIISASDDGSSFSIENLSQPSTFVQGVNFADINNDGWLDAFVCHDDGAARVFGNNGDGTFTYQPMWLNLVTEPASDNSGNYGSVWSDVDNDGDVDLYIAHCRQGVNDPTDPRRINQLFLNNGDGTYTQDIANVSGLRIGAQSWTADFGDIDNDGDFDCFITNHDVSSQVLENDGSGHFTDITASSGILDVIQGAPIQGVFRDFDNDGFVDILVAGSYQYIFRNNGNKTFSAVEGIFDNNNMESFAVGDLNSDGFQDIYGGYANIYTDPSSIPDALWMNDGNDNHFFGLTLRGVQSNKGGVGTKIQLHSSLGIQTREVRSGESYGISNSLQVHFGLGQVETIDSVVVNWPSGTHDVIYLPIRDQYLTFGEGGCLTPAIGLTALGATTFCSGQSVDIQAPDGYSYHWNNGDSTQITTVQTAGEYRVTVTAADGCTAVSNSIQIVVDPIQIPLITVTGDSIFCTGGSALLTSSTAVSYWWNNGATTQSITAQESGQYVVTTQGICNVFLSAPASVHVLLTDLPLATNDTIFTDSVAILSAIGSTLQWYETIDSPTSLFTGNPFYTPSLTESTTYWVSNTTSYDQPNAFVGMVDHQGSAFSDNSYNGGLVFDCYTPFKLSTTKVYTSKAGNRQINLFNDSGVLLQSKTVSIPIGTTVIDLGFDIPIGTDFLLTTEATVNQSVLGTAGPQLRRSNQGCVYPYEIPGIVKIKNSSFDETRYYYFFDWQVDFNGYDCESDRVPVTATVLTSGTTTPGWVGDINVFPNPTSGSLNVSVSNYRGNIIRITLKNIQGVSLESTQTAVAGTFEYTTNLSALAKGIYWLELSGDNGIVRKKVVIQ